MYYLTVTRGEEDIVRRETFEDYGEAMAALSRYVQPRGPGRAVLAFHTELIDGKFARTYLTVTPPDEVDPGLSFHEERRHLAVKQYNAYAYDHSYFFLIESAVGMVEADRCAAEADEEDE